MPSLVVEKGHDKGKAVPVTSGGTVIIGRDSSTALPLRDTMSSRMHFKIEGRADGYWISDLESMNGTYLNGSKIREAVKLTFGDLVKVGETLFTFHSDDTSATTLTGQRIGGYRIIERLGRGGMGTVYKAEQIDLQRIVALKVISEEHTKDKEFVELFIHEARAAAKLNHPNLIQVYDVKRHGDVYYFSMEYVSGGSVQEVLNRQRKIPVADAVRMLIDAARGLDYAHRKGILHRDVKPDNLMISETGTVKIGDMGLARGLNEKVGPEEETSVIGTPHYIAPEQVLGRPADFRSDQYSLGAAAYRMLAGVTPFNAPSVRELVNRKVREDAVSIQEHNREVPRSLAEIVARMMARDPDRRFPSMAEAIAALERFQRGQPGRAAEDAREASGPVETLVANKTLLVGAICLLAVLVVGAVTGLVFLSGPSGAGTPAVPEGPDLKLAGQMLENAKLLDRTIKDRKDVRSLEKVIAEYSDVERRFPGTDYATKAAEYRTSLDQALREVQSDRRLLLAEAEEISNHRRIADSFKAGRLDLSPADAIVSAYEAFARAPENRGTPAAGRAAEGADVVRRWKARVEQQRSGYESAQRKAQAASEAGRFREARSVLLAARDDIRKAEADGERLGGRYRPLFYDEIAEADAGRVAADALSAWAKTEEEARNLARDRNYESALALVAAALQDPLDEVAMRANALKSSLEREWANVAQREMEEKDAAKAKALAAARAGFARESQAARDLVLRYDFKGALARIRGLRDSNTAEEFRQRLDRRVAELERVAHLKENFINVIKAPGNPYRVKKQFNLQGLEGLIDDADDKSLKIALAAGGTADVAWTQLSPAAFYDLIKRHWKYSREQRQDASDQCDLAALCLEFGLYADARAEIDTVLAAMKEPQYVVSETVRKFCEDYVERIEKGESAEYEEIEAGKHLERLDVRMRNLEYERARYHIDILRSRYRKTARYREAQSEIQRHLQTIDEQGGEVLRKNVSADRYRGVQQRVADELTAARKAQSDIVLRLTRLGDPFEKNFYLGGVYAAAGDWRASTEKYLEARRVGELMVARRDVGREFQPVLGLVYAELLRNFTLLKEKKNAEALRNDGSRRFVNPDTKMEEPWWAQTLEWHATWSETVLPQEEKKVLRLRDELRGAADDPQKIWALAQSCAEGVFNLQEARGYYLYLLENHPEFAQVQNGNCLYRIAELLFAARDVREAIRRYRELSESQKEHPKVLETGRAGVQSRLEDCYKLLVKLGYAKEKGAK